ncbi:MAG: hypothetical protein V1679_01275 [Candidatus Peregrinibacteria bacterium]
MNKIIVENFIKNIILLIILGLTYSPTKEFLLNSELATDKALAGDLLVAVSILAVTACFGNFAFTYEKVNKENVFSRMISHLTTGILMLLIGLSIIISSTLSDVLIKDFTILKIGWILLYIGSVIYDFWDLQRVYLKK